MNLLWHKVLLLNVAVMRLTSSLAWWSSGWWMVWTSLTFQDKVPPCFYCKYVSFQRLTSSFSPNSYPQFFFPAFSRIWNIKRTRYVILKFILSFRKCQKQRCFNVQMSCCRPVRNRRRKAKMFWFPSVRLKTRTRTPVHPKPTATRAARSSSEVQETRTAAFNHRFSHLDVKYFTLQPQRPKVLWVWLTSVCWRAARCSRRNRGREPSTSGGCLTTEVRF